MLYQQLQEPWLQLGLKLLSLTFPEPKKWKVSFFRSRAKHSFALAFKLRPEAFLAHQLAPLELRRDISALGLLRKIQLGEIHCDFSGLFPKLANEVETST